MAMENLIRPSFAKTQPRHISSMLVLGAQHLAQQSQAGLYADAISFSRHMAVRNLCLVYRLHTNRLSFHFVICHNSCQGRRHGVRRPEKTEKKIPPDRRPYI